MLTRRTSKNRKIGENSNELKKDKLSTKHKLDDKLITPDLNTQLKLRGKRHVESLCSSASKNKNKRIRSVLTEKNNFENGRDKILIKSPEKENINKRNCRRGTTKQSSLPKNELSVLKENNFDGKNKRKEVNVPVKKQKRTIKCVDQRCIEDYYKPDDKIESFMTANCRPGKFTDQENVLKKTTSRTETDFKKQITSIPIWRRQLNLEESKPFKKRNSKVDVYDIFQDEELMASAKKAQKKPIRFQRKVKKTVIKKKNHIRCMKDKNNKINSGSNNQNFDEKRHLLETHQIPSDAVTEEIALAKEKENCVPSDQNITPSVHDEEIALAKVKENCVPSDQNITPSVHDEEIALAKEKENCVRSDQNITPSVHDEDYNQNLFASEFVQLNEPIELFVHSDLDLQSSDPKPQKKINVSDLANELEESFQIPKMTSTPDAIHVKTGVQVQNVVIDVSNIAAMNKDCINITIDTPCDSADKKSLPKKRRDEEDIGNITLFESPTKERIRKKGIKTKSPKKSIQINLFGEIANSPSKENNLEDSVSKPNKAYHTPDNFKTHIARTKRMAEVGKRVIKKSKEDILIEKMSQHFNDVDNTKLCIE